MIVYYNGSVPKDSPTLIYLKYLIAKKSRGDGAVYCEVKRYLSRLGEIEQNNLKGRLMNEKEGRPGVLKDLLANGYFKR